MKKIVLFFVLIVGAFVLVSAGGLPATNINSLLPFRLLAGNNGSCMPMNQAVSSKVAKNTELGKLRDSKTCLTKEQIRALPATVMTAWENDVAVMDGKPAITNRETFIASIWQSKFGADAANQGNSSGINNTGDNSWMIDRGCVAMDHAWFTTRIANDPKNARFEDRTPPTGPPANYSGKCLTWAQLHDPKFMPKSDLAKWKGITEQMFSTKWSDEAFLKFVWIQSNPDQKPPWEISENPKDNPFDFIPEVPAAK